ncbi:MAG: hypothetical protein CMG66_00680 [Candidatus Marinimicrobia bacterium]|nr:hypothetical protein [Candidatus Neomarinimicrobiota bacterium]|tara:strand:+ start:14819 stop:15853 length:1035 start_codon:yes stop_codon:yes gene_type:complete
MNKPLLFIISLFISISFPNDSIFSNTNIGAYGELHWNTEKQKIDFHRFVIFLGYNWDKNWSFKSEVQLKNNVVGDSHDGTIELQKGYVNYNSELWGFKGGVLVAPVGIINPYHEPPTFLSVERPFYSTEIIPTTWFGNGFSFYGNIGNIQLELAMLEDLNGKNILEGETKSIKYGQNKGSNATATDILGTKIFSISWIGIDGLRIAGSYALNDAPVEIDPASGEAIDILSTTLIELNTMYSKNNIHAVFEYGMNEFSHPSSSWKNSGYYLDIGYNIGSLIDMNSVLMPWIRTSSYSIDSIKTNILLYGLTYKPIPSISFKVDMGTNKTSNTKSNILNIGLGYMF